MKIQPRTRQKKHQTSTRHITAIKEAIERDAIRWGCSKAWIMTTALGAFYGIDVMKPYQVKTRTTKSKLIKFRKRA